MPEAHGSGSAPGGFEGGSPELASCASITSRVTVGESPASLTSDSSSVKWGH